jgi:hypothetical protein
MVVGPRGQGEARDVRRLSTQSSAGGPVDHILDPPAIAELLIELTAL